MARHPGTVHLGGQQKGEQVLCFKIVISVFFREGRGKNRPGGNKDKKREVKLRLKRRFYMRESPDCSVGYSYMDKDTVVVALMLE